MVSEAVPLLKVEGLTRRFGQRTAVDGLSFDLNQGEVLGLLGPNGAGKSTTFALLAGLLWPDAGKVWLEGVPLGIHDVSLRARLGIVFQKNSLDEQLTAHENLMLGARLYAVPHKEALGRAQELLQMMGLLERAHERVLAWSGGMRRRLELARALIHRPDILLMDEPTQGLDEAAFRSFWAHLNAVRKQRALTVLLTTHRPDEASLCDRLAVIDEGRLVLCQTPLELAALVGGEVITLHSTLPEEVERVSRDVLGLSPKFREGRVSIECAGGHALIPRLVEALPKGSVLTVELRRPTLADAFEKLTGHALTREAVSEPTKKRSLRS